MLKAAKLKVSPRRLLATAHAAAKYLAGQQIEGFTVQQVKKIPELSLVAVNLINDKTKSHHLHLDSHDSNNVFGVAFKTNAPDGTGLPHILEHLVLCGSEKFPVRDPFFKMTNRSLSNFMNAMTGHDFTYYPFATTNKKDYENLMDVYLSSVFLPTLTKNNFRQEGWRLEHEDYSDKSTPIVYKGVVFNEMKGQNSNTDYFFYKSFLEAIYPSLNNSGGNPENIPDLKHEQMTAFYRSAYNPGNCKTFTYGNFPLSDHLAKISEYFNKVSDRENRAASVKYPIFTEDAPKNEAIVTGPVDTMTNRPVDHQYKASITWNLGNPLDESNHYDVFLWKVLNSLLIDGHSSPFYQELIESDLADDFSPNIGVDVTTALLSFTMGLNNCSLATVKNLEAKVKEILNSRVIPQFAANDALYTERVEALLHQIELNLKRHKPDFGLNLLNSLVPSWINNTDPVKSLQVEEVLERFKEDFANQGLGLFKTLLEKTILNDSCQKFKFTMKPDTEFNNKLISEEENRLKTVVDSLSESDKKEIYSNGLELAQEQQTETDASILPSLSIEDIPVNGDKYPVSYNGKTQRRIVDTNGLTYVTATKSINYIPTKYIKYLSLFTSCLTNLAGTTKTSINDLETRISKTTGGVSFNIKSVVNPYNLLEVDLRLVLSGSSLAQNSPEIYNLWQEVLSSTKFDADDKEVVDKLYQLIKNMTSNQLNNISDRGHSYANWASDAKLTVNKYITDQLSGLTNIEFVSELNNKMEAQGKEFLSQEVLPILAEIQQLVLANSDYKFRIVGSADIVEQNEKLIEGFERSIQSGTVHKTNHLEGLIEQFKAHVGTESSQNTLINLPFQVGHASLAKLGVPYVSPDGAALQVVAQLYTFKHLHSVIRESNSAYGGGMLYDGLGGTINFYSYRDPNPLKSVDSFKESFDYGLTTKWEPSDLEQAKLRIFQSLDAPMSVSSQGATEFQEGITDEMRQARRENFLNVGTNEITDVINKYLIPGKNVVSVVGNNEVLNVQNLKDWTIRNLKV